MTGTLLQAHEGRAYPLRVPIRVVTETGEEEHWIWSASKESPFRFETKAPPKKVAVDPDHEVFRKIPTNRVAPCFSAVLNAPQRVGFGDEKVLAGFGLANPGIPQENAAHFYLGLEGEQLAHIQAEAVRQDGSLRLEEGKFSLKGQTYDSPADGLLFSYRRRNGSFATFFHGNAPEAFGRVSYLPYYASEGWVVFKNGRPAARGAHPGDPRTRATVGRAHRRPPSTLLDDILWLTETKHGGRAPGTRSAHELANELRGRIVKAGLRYVPWPPFPVRRANLVGPRLLTILDGEEKIRLPDSFYPMHAGASVAEPVVFNRVVEHPADDVREALVLLPEDAASDVAARYAKSGARVVAVVSSDESFTKRGREAAWPGAVPPALAQKVRARRGSLSAIAAKEIASSGGPRLDVPLIYLAPKAAAELKRRNKGGVIECRTSWTHYTTSNIVATLGARRGMRKSVLVSAHWDGVGKIGGRVAEGASDNAAGVAVLLWVAEQLKRNEASLKRPVVFALFGAEELGLLGSRQFVQGLKSPKVPIPVPLVAINIDGIGSAPKRDIFLIGRSLVPALFKRFETARAKTNLELGRDIDKFAYREGSDHWPLHEAGIPAVTVYCADYRAMNTLLDSSELVDMELVRETARLVYRMVRELATAESLDELK